MKFNVMIAGRGVVVGLSVLGEQSQITVEPGLALDCNGVEISPGVFSILLDGVSHEVRVAPAPDGSLTLQTGHHEFKAEIADPRAWSGRRHCHVEAEGRQQILAPMPGKVVRLLVKAGDEVKAGQGLLVVEAMKMQNEVRSPKTGKVERLLAKEGQPVNAGEILAWID
jgi:biotin carboxyl carrier protein